MPPTSTTPSTTQKVTLDVDQDRLTGGIQVSINAVDDGENGGHGYRIAGPKYLGASTSLRRHLIDERDAAEIRRYLDLCHPTVPAAVDRQDVEDALSDELHAVFGEAAVERALIAVMPFLGGPS